MSSTTFSAESIMVALCRLYSPALPFAYCWKVNPDPKLRDLVVVVLHAYYGNPGQAKEWVAGQELTLGCELAMLDDAARGLLQAAGGSWTLFQQRGAF